MLKFFSLQPILIALKKLFSLLTSHILYHICLKILLYRLLIFLLCMEHRFRLSVIAMYMLHLFQKMDHPHNNKPQ